MVTLGTKVNDDPSLILGYAMDHLQIRLQLNDGEQISQRLLSAAHCTLAHAWIRTEGYKEAIYHCQQSRMILTNDPEDFIWYQWSFIYEAWSYIGMEDLDRAENAIVVQYRYQRERLPPNESYSLMYVDTTSRI